MANNVNGSIYYEYTIDLVDLDKKAVSVFVIETFSRTSAKNMEKLNSSLEGFTACTPVSISVTDGAGATARGQTFRQTGAQDGIAEPPVLIGQLCRNGRRGCAF